MYLSSGNLAPGPKFDFKLRWFERLATHLQELLDTGAPVVPIDLDVYKPERWVENALFRRKCATPRPGSATSWSRARKPRGRGALPVKSCSATHDELVPVSGRPPIRMKKARYFEERSLIERAIVPPKPENRTTTDIESADDWTRLPMQMAKMAASAPKAAIRAPDDTANAGIRREPELVEQEEVAREGLRQPDREAIACRVGARRRRRAYTCSRRDRTSRRNWRRH